MRSDDGPLRRIAHRPFGAGVRLYHCDELSRRCLIYPVCARYFSSSASSLSAF